MEGMTHVPYPENSITGDEAITCNMSTVLIPSLSNGISDDKILPNHPTCNVSINGTLSNKEYLNGISSLHEMTNHDNLPDDSLGISEGSDANSASKIVPPTIFENAVKVVKNLFSPAKGHGLFSRGTPHTSMNEHDLKREDNEDIQKLNKSLLFKLDEVSYMESKERVSPLNNLENNMSSNEEDVSTSATKNCSHSISVHDNTNDSYTTTVSRMDESFQSTITHFDENIQNEVEKANEPLIVVENCSDGSLNETMETYENSLDNTLRKNLSTCSIKNGDLNGTFEVPAVSNAEGARVEEFGLEKENQIALTQLPNQVLPQIESPGNRHDINSLTSVPEQNFFSFQEEGLLKMGEFSSTPSKQNSSKELSPTEKSFPILVSENDRECCQINEENIDKLQIFGTEDMENVKQGQHSGANQSSENQFLFFSFGKDSGFPEKSPTSESGDLEKNVSTNTIILPKCQPETFDCSSIKENKEPINTTHDHECKNDEIGIPDETNVIKSAIMDNQCQEQSSYVLEGNILFPKLENNAISNDAGRKYSIELEPKIDQIAKNATSSRSNFSGGICSPYTKPEVTIVDLRKLNLIGSLQVDQLKPEGYSADETGIPLASQKSYTVLHNPNPDLNRPVVLDYMCDVQAEKLNDIILGNCAFSDLGVFNNCSEELISDASKSASKITDSDGSANPYCAQPEITESNMTSESIHPKKEIFDVKPATVSGEIQDNLIHTKQKFHAHNELFPVLEKQRIDSSESSVENMRFLDQVIEPAAANVQSQDASTILIKEDKLRENESVVVACHGPILVDENSSEADIEEIGGDRCRTNSSPVPALGDGIQNASYTENNTLRFQFCGDGGSASTELIREDKKQIFQEDPNVLSNSVTKTEVIDFQTQIEKVTSDLEKLKMNDSMKKDSAVTCSQSNDTFPKFNDSLVITEQSTTCENSKNSIKGQISGSDAELTQFIQEQFSAFDIEKICSVVDDIPELNLSRNIVLASQQFDQSFHEKTIIESDGSKANNFVMNDDKSLSSALDFLDSIKGKPSGRDFSRESLYIKFDPLVQSKHSTGLLDISEGDKENLIISPGPKNTGSIEPLIPITPLKQTINVSSPLSPLTPVTQKNESKLSAEKLNKIRELQSEITRSRELFIQMEEVNKEKMNNYEREITKLTGRACVLEDKLKESEEMEKSLVKKLNVQNESMNRLKNIMEEYLTYIGKLTDQIEMERMESHKQIEVLTEERDYYMNHLQNTEQAFSDVHSKYEKCKKAVEIYKKNEEAYKTSIEDFKERVEQYREKINVIQENAAKEMNRLQEKMSEMKLNHAQEISRFKAQLRKTELKVQTIQEALDQKVKENQELARICDELIDGKKRNC